MLRVTIVLLELAVKLPSKLMLDPDQCQELLDEIERLKRLLSIERDDEGDEG